MKSNNQCPNYRNQPFNSKLKLLGFQRPQHKGKKTLVLNLDETLLHSVFNNDDKSDFQFTTSRWNKVFSVSMFKRPFLDNFLSHIFKKFEVVFYTPALWDYANKVIDFIDPNNIASGRLFRDSWKIKEDYFIKDIEKLGRYQSNVIVLDNNTMSCSEWIQNTVPIKPWFSDPKDKELKDIIPILDSLAKVKDVRVIIQNIIDKMEESEEKQAVKRKGKMPFEDPKNIKVKER